MKVLHLRLHEGRENTENIIGRYVWDGGLEGREDTENISFHVMN